MTSSIATSPDLDASAPAAGTRSRLAALIGAHPVVDVYANFVPPLLGLLQVRCDLTGWQVASLVAIGPLVSGGCQPLFAWLADRMNLISLGPIGLLVAAVGVSSVGLAQDYVTLLAIYVVGMLGVGAFHPVAAATVGRLAGARRSAAVTLFFTAGMIGSATGPVISATVVTSEWGGFDVLGMTLVPGVIMALVIFTVLRGMAYNPLASRSEQSDPADAARRWAMVAMLFTSNVLRYSLNTAFLYLFVPWSQLMTAERFALTDPVRIAEQATPLNGRMNALMMAGMALGGLTAGLLIRPGRERWPFVFIPIALSPAAALFVISSAAWGHVLAFAVGVGYASILPASISLAQRILPHRSSLASSLMMGGAWSVGTAGSLVAYQIAERIGLDAAFVVFAVVLFMSGILSIPLRTERYV